jgi:hypothetical protein
LGADLLEVQPKNPKPGPRSNGAQEGKAEAT